MVVRWDLVVIVQCSSISPSLVCGFVVPIIFLIIMFICVHLGLDCLQVLGYIQDCFCAWFGICDSIKLVLVMFSIDLLSSIVLFERDFILSAITILACISCG